MTARATCPDPFNSLVHSSCPLRDNTSLFCSVCSAMSKDSPSFPSDTLLYSSDGASKPAKWGIGFLTPVLILGGLLGAAVIAIFHHFFDAFLDGKPVNGFWDQTKSHRVETALATMFKIAATTSGGISLCQVVCGIRVSLTIPFTDVLLKSRRGTKSAVDPSRSTI